MDEHEPPVSKIILETHQDYREAIAALDLQLAAAMELSDNIAIVAQAIELYEQENGIEPEVT